MLGNLHLDHTPLAVSVALGSSFLCAGSLCEMQPGAHSGLHHSSAAKPHSGSATFYPCCGICFCKTFTGCPWASFSLFLMMYGDFFPKKAIDSLERAPRVSLGMPGFELQLEDHMVFLLDHTILALGLSFYNHKLHCHHMEEWPLTFSDKELGDFLVGKCSLGKSQDPRLSPGSLFLPIIATIVEPGSVGPNWGSW